VATVIAAAAAIALTCFFTNDISSDATGGGEPARESGDETGRAGAL